MSKILFVSFFFLISCSTPQSRVFPNNEFSRIEKVEEFQFTPDKIDRETGTSVLARVTLRKLIAKQIVSLSTVYFPPDNFRVDIFTTGLPKLLLLVARDSRAVQLVVPSEQAVYLGDAASRPLTRVIGFPLPELLLLNLRFLLLQYPLWQYGEQ